MIKVTEQSIIDQLDLLVVPEFEEVSSVNRSYGIENASEIPCLGPDGRLDVMMMSKDVLVNFEPAVVYLGLYGSTESAKDLHLNSTTQTSKGKIYFGNNCYLNEVNSYIQLGQPTDTEQQILSFIPADTDNGRFNFSIGTNGVWPGSPRENKILFFGYNQNEYGAIEKTGEPAIFIGFEVFYAPVVGDEYMEAYLQYDLDNGVDSWRPWMWSIDRNTNEAYGSFLGNDFYFNDVDGTQRAKLGPTYLILYGSVAVYQETNNIAFLYQKNAAGDAYVPILKVNASDKVEILANVQFNGTLDISNQVIITMSSTVNPGLILRNDSSDPYSLRLGATANYFDFHRKSATGSLYIQGNQAGYENIVLCPTAGRVGIGTEPAVGNLLDVEGSIGIVGTSDTVPAFILGTAHGIRYTVAAGYSNLEAVNFPVTGWEHLHLQGRSAPDQGVGMGWVGIGMVTAPREMLDVAGPILSTQYIRAEGYNYTLASGAGVEIGYLGGVGYVQSYNRAGSAYTPLNINSSLLSLGTDSGTLTDAYALRITGTSVPAAGVGMEMGYVAGTGYITCYNRTAAAYVNFLLNAYESIFQMSGTEHLVLDPILVSGVSPGVSIGQRTGQGWYFWFNTLNGNYGQDVDNSAIWINYFGYQGGVTRFRDFVVADGKNSPIVFVDGSSGHVGIGTSAPATAKLEVIKDGGFIQIMSGTANFLQNFYTINETINSCYGSDTDTAGLYINYYGYIGGATRFRDTFILDGKGATLLAVDGSAGTVTVKRNLIIGESGAGVDYQIEFDGETSNGILKWMEDEDYFEFSDGILIPSGEQIYFRDTGIYIDSQADTFLDITADGAIRLNSDTYWVGEGKGLPYGSCYGNEIAWAQVDMAIDTTYLITDADMSDGQLNLVTHDGNGKLTVSVAGRYLVNWGVSCELDTVNKHINVGVAVDGTKVDFGKQHFESHAANEQFTMSGTCILDLAANATVELYVLTTDAGTPDILVDHVNLTIVQIGGT